MAYKLTISDSNYIFIPKQYVFYSDVIKNIGIN
jgi:hypothetical protein